MKTESATTPPLQQNPVCNEKGSAAKRLRNNTESATARKSAKGDSPWKTESATAQTLQHHNIHSYLRHVEWLDVLNGMAHSSQIFSTREENQ